MYSRSFIALILLGLCLPILGDEALLKESLSDSKKFKGVTEVTAADSSSHFYSFQVEGVQYRAICDSADTKSGTLTYVIVLDSEGVICHFDIPAFQNQHNASLTSKFFLRQFLKKKPAEKKIALGRGVDAISGATMSTNSLIDAVNSSVLELNAQ